MLSSGSEDRVTGPAQWFYALVAGSALIAALTFTVRSIAEQHRGEWVRAGEATVLNRRTGTVCGIAKGETWCMALADGRQVGRPHLALQERINSLRRQQGIPEP